MGLRGERQERGRSNGKRQLSECVQIGLADQSKGLHPQETPQARVSTARRVGQG